MKLSTMKASRFVKAFEHDVDYWERTLSHIMEVVELLLTIQRQWMYLDVSDCGHIPQIHLYLPMIYSKHIPSQVRGFKPQLVFPPVYISLGA